MCAQSAAPDAGAGGQDASAQDAAASRNPPEATPDGAPTEARPPDAGAAPAPHAEPPAGSRALGEDAPGEVSDALETPARPALPREVEESPSQPEETRQAPASTAPPPERVPAALSPVERTQQRRLNLQLEQVEAEIESTHMLWPWVAMAAGAALLTTGLTAGAVEAADCAGSCGVSFWPSWAIAGGATIGLGGLVWFRFKQADLHQLQSRRYRLRQDLFFLMAETGADVPVPSPKAPPY